MDERGVARARRRCFERRLVRTGRGTGQIRASNEPPRRGLKIDISVFAPSSTPRGVRGVRGAARRGAARRGAARRLSPAKEVGYASPLVFIIDFPGYQSHASIYRIDRPS